MENILVTGGCGYVGSKLVPRLISEGWKVTALDNQWFGKNLEENDGLLILKKDTRDLTEQDLSDYSRVIHLANIANDPAVDLDQTLSWEVNVLATQQLIDKVVRVGKAKQFIYASSGSVYGVKDEKSVTEDLTLVPISAYNKTKMVAERVLKSYEDNVILHSIRPATVCGLAPRMRLDVAVNILTFQALDKKKITVLGGKQIRPNIHIDDMVSVYVHFLDNYNKIDSGQFNAGFENISILEIAKLVRKHIDCELEIKPSRDPRSYRQDSEKLRKTGFVQKKSVEDAILEIKSAYLNGLLQDKDSYHTIKSMKKVINETR